MKPIPTLLSVSTLLLLQGAALAQQMSPPRDMLPESNAQPQKTNGKTAPIKFALIMPDDKTSEKVTDNERNPFSRNEDANKGLVVKASNEENIIREQLLKLRVVGQSPGSRGGMRVMLGDMILSEDQVVPQVLPDQTLNLRVGSIREDAIELVWVEKKNTGMPPRTLTIPMDLRPKVRYQLQGQPVSDGKDAKGAKTGTASRMGQQVLPGLTQLQSESPKRTASLQTPAPVAEIVAENPAGTPQPNTGEAAAPTQESMTPLKKALDLLNSLTKPVADKQ